MQTFSFCFPFVELGICITFSTCTYITYWNVIILYYGISVLKKIKTSATPLCWDWKERETKCINDEHDVKVLQNMLKCFTLHISWYENTYTYLIQGRVHVSDTRSLTCTYNTRSHTCSYDTRSSTRIWY